MRVRTGAAARVNACPRAVPALKVPAFRTNALERRRASQEVGTRATSVLGEARIVISAITFSFVANSVLLCKRLAGAGRTSFNKGSLGSFAGRNSGRFDESVDLHCHSPDWLCRADNLEASQVGGAIIRERAILMQGVIQVVEDQNGSRTQKR